MILLQEEIYFYTVYNDIVMLVFVPQGMLGVRLTVSAIYDLSGVRYGFEGYVRVCVSRLNGVGKKHNCRMWEKKSRRFHCAPLHAVSVQFSVLFVCAFGAVQTA